MAASNHEPKDIADGITRTLREITYVALGFGVLGFQKAQVRRRQCQGQLEQVLKRFRERSASS
jgi:hypothetical protein